MNTLTWNGTDYYAKIEGGTLYVGGDAFIEAKFDMANALFSEMHHVERGASLDELKNSHESEWDSCLAEAEADLLDIRGWVGHALTLEPGQMLSDLASNVDSWIVEEEG